MSIPNSVQSSIDASNKQHYPPLGLTCLFDLAEAALLAMPAATLLAEAAKLLLAALCGLLATEAGTDTFDLATRLPAGTMFPADAALAAVAWS